MRNIITKLVALFGLLPAAMAAGAAQKVNPTTQINWPLATGTTSPSASCTSSIYGQPYTNRSTGDFYVCAASGWVLVAGGGGGGVGGSGATGFYALWTAATTLGNGSLDDGITTAGFDTFSKPVQVICSTCATQVDLTYNSGHAPAGAAAVVSLAPDSAGKNLTVNGNNTAYGPVAPLASGFVSGHCGQPTSSGGVWTTADSGSACGSGGGVGTVLNVYPFDSYGTGDGNYGANTGTDNTSAWTTAYAAALAGGGGVITFTCGKQYRFANAGPVIVDSGVSIGTTTPCAGVNGSGTATNAPVIFTSSTSATVVEIGGVDSTHLINGSGMWNLSINRASGVTPAAAAKGLYVHWDTQAIFNNNNINDSPTCADITGAFSYGNGIIQNNSCLYGFTGVAYPGSGSLIGWNLHGSTTGFGTTVMYKNQTSRNASNLGTRTLYGYSIDGILQDLNIDAPQTATTDYGIYCNSCTVGQDVQITNVTLDRAGTGIYLSGLDANTVEIRGGWITTADSGSGIELANTGGVSISDIKFYTSAAHPAIYVHGTTAGRKTNAILNNRFFFASSTSAQAISANASPGLNIIGNTIDGNSMTFSSPMIQLVSQSNSNIKANWLGSGAGTGLSFDSSSNSNCCSNLNSLITFTTSDAGTGNSFGTTLANVLTMNNGGSGAASGSTFDGSAAKTISYNTIGALAAASGVFTGTPDASGATQFKLPVAASGASLANGELIYDSTNKNWHGWVNGADTIFAPLASGFTTGHCGQPTLHTNTWQIDDAGGACGVSGGGASFSATTSGTNTTAAMVVGSGASMDISGTGTINATKISGITITGTPSTGYVPTATSSSTATWQAAGGGGNYVNIGGSVTWTHGSGTGSYASGAYTVATADNGVTISSIPGTYLGLKIKIIGQAAAWADMSMQFNSDTGSNYAQEQITQTGTGSVTGAGSVSGTTLGIGNLGATNVSTTDIDIPLYAGTTFQKIEQATSTSFNSVSSATQNKYNVIGGLWANTAAITTVKLFFGSTTFTAGTTFIIYGYN